MQDNMGSKMMDGNLDAVAASFDKVATMSPDPSWAADWSKMSKDGASAARKGGDVGTQGAKAACKACHDKYKNDYKQKFRTKAVP
jgi:cytochrome c5